MFHLGEHSGIGIPRSAENRWSSAKTKDIFFSNECHRGDASRTPPRTQKFDFERLNGELALSIISARCPWAREACGKDSVSHALPLFQAFQVITLAKAPVLSKRRTRYTLLFLYIILINSERRVDCSCKHRRCWPSLLDTVTSVRWVRCYSKSYRLRCRIIRFVIRYIRPRHTRYTATMSELWMRRIHESGTPASWRTRVCKPFVSKPA